MLNETLKLYPFQEEALERLKSEGKVAFFWEMGTGKTYVGAEKLNELSQYSLFKSRNLVICQKSKIDDWIGHFRKYYSKFEVFNLTCGKEMKEFLRITSELDIPFHVIGVINYDLVWRRSKLLEVPFHTLLLDESSLIQNSKTKRTKFMFKINFNNIILLSGTPCSGKYENLWSQLKLLGYNISESLFLSQYVNFELLDIGPRIVKVVSKKHPYKNVERLKTKLKDYHCDFLKSDEVITLPEQVFIPVSIPVSGDYKRFIKTCIIQDDEKELVGNTNLTKRLYSRMLCGQYSEEKLEAFKDLLESTNDRVLVFYNFNEELEKLEEIARELDKPLSFCNGSQKDFSAYEEEENSVTFLQYQAGAMGLNLQKANKIVYFTLPERSELFEQSKKRTNRIGQKRTCFYYLMICKDSVEKSIYNALLRREDYNQKLFEKEVLNAGSN